MSVDVFSIRVLLLFFHLFILFLMQSITRPFIHVIILICVTENGRGQGSEGTEEESSYEGICRRIIKKCVFLLLAIRPAISGGIACRIYQFTKHYSSR